MPGAGYQPQDATPQSTLNRKGRLPRTLSSSSRQRPTSFFFRSEDSMDDDTKTSQSRESTFGVQSLEDAVSLADLLQEREPLDTQHTEDTEVEDTSLLESHISVESATQIPMTPEMAPHTTFTHGSAHTSPIEPLPRQLSTATLSLPLTPIFLRSPRSESMAPSSPRSPCSLKSFRLSSDEDSIAGDSTSQASTGKEEGEHVPTEQGQHFPQLVMPSISMPSRRAFTESGKNIGKLRIMLAGAHGVGKTSLMKSIVQTCEHIVHVDPLPSTSSSITMGRPQLSRRTSTAVNLQQASQVVEIGASTRAYPSWWTEMDESRILRRRKSSFGEIVLERNISFVDTPGFTANERTSGAREGHLIIQHVESLLQRNASLSTLSDGEVLSILSGSGGVQVDLVIYIFTKEPTTEENDLLRYLCQLTNVIPTIGKADLLSEEELSTLKEQVSTSFDTENIRPFFFNEPPTEPRAGSRTKPYVISSAPSKDDDNMDASVLMSPDYVQPLITSDLAYLVSKIFDPEGAAYLRHSAARKFLHWRRIASTSQTLHAAASAPPSPSAPSSPSALNRSTTTSILTAPSPSNSPYTLARLSDHAQREERLAQLRLARWAADLQRSLANERARFAALQQAERHGWLHSRLDECEAGAALVRRDDYATKSPVVVAVPDRRDPLGLLEWDDRVRARAVVLAKIFGGGGVVGAVVLWVMRTWGAGAGAGAGGGGASWGWWSGVNE